MQGRLQTIRRCIRRKVRRAHSPEWGLAAANERPRARLHRACWQAQVVRSRRGKLRYRRRRQVVSSRQLPQ